MNAEEETQTEGVLVHVFRDGDEIRVNIVDENSSVLVTFQSDEEFEKFKEEINKPLEDFGRSEGRNE